MTELGVWTIVLLFGYLIGILIIRVIWFLEDDFAYRRGYKDGYADGVLDVKERDEE